MTKREQQGSLKEFTAGMRICTSCSRRRRILLQDEQQELTEGAQPWGSSCTEVNADAGVERDAYYRGIYLRVNSRDLLQEMSEQQGSLSTERLLLVLDREAVVQRVRLVHHGADAVTAVGLEAERGVSASIMRSNI